MKWKDYKFISRLFEVSDTGKVRNEQGHILKGSLHKLGFRKINLKFYNETERYTKGLIIHRMVAECWVENPDNKPYVIHLNGDLEDNRAKNLAWATPEEKIAHQKKLGKLQPDRKLTQKNVVKIKKMLLENKTTVEAIAREFKVSHTQIHRIKRNENWSDVIIVVQNNSNNKNTA